MTVVRPTITLRRWRPWFSLTIPLGDGSPEAGGGQPTWEQVARPKRTALTDYTGSAPLTLKVPCVFDAFPDGSVEADLLRLAALYVKQAGRDRPSVVQIAGPLGSAAEWVIESVEWGESLRRPDGQRCRQWFTLNMLEYVAADVVTKRQASPAARVASSRAFGAQEGVTARTTVLGAADGRSESLLQIAARTLDDPNRWVEIAALNDMAYPNSAVEGQTLRLPT